MVSRRLIFGKLKLKNVKCKLSIICKCWISEASCVYSLINYRYIRLFHRETFSDLLVSRIKSFDIIHLIIFKFVTISKVLRKHRMCVNFRYYDLWTQECIMYMIYYMLTKNRVISLDRILTWTMVIFSRWKVLAKFTHYVI